MRTENRGITHEDAIDEIYNILDKYGVSDSDNINSMRGGGRIAGQRY